MHKIQKTVTLILLVAAAWALAPHAAWAAPTEKELIAILQSDAGKGDKGMACKKLAIWGSEAAVPALAKFLGDWELASWARIALEAIPGEAANKALRDAMPTLKGRLLIGTINSLAVRRDAKAVEALTAKLGDDEADVASAAAEALGRIGGPKAVAALTAALADAPAAVKPAVGYGCVLCAERALKQGKTAAAIALYDKIRASDLPAQRVREATRGAILARGTDGLALLVEQLKARDKEQFWLGLRIARELPGGEVTEALVAELGNLPPDRRSLLLLALADRSDPKALPALLAAAKTGPKQVRLMAMGALDKVGDASCVPVLLAAAGDADAEIAARATTALTRLPAGEADAALAARLGESTGTQRKTLIDLAAARRIAAALPALAACTRDDDPGCRMAAVAAVGTIGGAKQVGDLVTALTKTKDAKERAAIDKALRTVCSRGGSACTASLAPLTGSGDPALRAIAMHALVCAGGADAMAAVKAGLNDKDAEVQDEAVRSLANWPSNWPDDAAVKQPLLALAKDGKKDLHRILALQGYLHYLRGTTKLSAPAKLAALKGVLPLAKRPDEKRLAIAALATVPAEAALTMLLDMTRQGGLREEACVAIVTLTQNPAAGRIPKAKRKAALETVLKTSRNRRIKRTAQNVLGSLR